MHVKDVNEAIGFWDSFALRISRDNGKHWVAREYNWKCGCNAFCTFGIEEDLWFIPCEEHSGFMKKEEDGLNSAVKNYIMDVLKKQLPREY